MTPRRLKTCNFWVTLDHRAQMVAKPFPMDVISHHRQRLFAIGASIALPEGHAAGGLVRLVLARPAPLLRVITPSIRRGEPLRSPQMPHA